MKTATTYMLRTAKRIAGQLPPFDVWWADEPAVVRVHLDLDAARFLADALQSAEPHDGTTGEIRAIVERLQEVLEAGK